MRYVTLIFAITVISTSMASNIEYKDHQIELKEWLCTAEKEAQQKTEEKIKEEKMPEKYRLYYFKNIISSYLELLKKEMCPEELYFNFLDILANVRVSISDSNQLILEVSKIIRNCVNNIPQNDIILSNLENAFVYIAKGKRCEVTKEMKIEALTNASIDSAFGLCLFVKSAYRYKYDKNNGIYQQAIQQRPQLKAWLAAFN